MNVQQFDTITRVAAEVPDRRKVLKLVGAAAVASVAGAIGSGVTEARDRALIIIGDVLSGNEVEVEVKNNNVALQVCAVIQDINVLFVNDLGVSVAKLTCNITQNAND